MKLPRYITALAVAMLLWNVASAAPPQGLQAFRAQTTDKDNIDKTKTTAQGAKAAATKTAPNAPAKAGRPSTVAKDANKAVTTPAGSPLVKRDPTARVATRLQRDFKVLRPTARITLLEAYRTESGMQVKGHVAVAPGPLGESLGTWILYRAAGPTSSFELDRSGRFTFEQGRQFHVDAVVKPAYSRFKLDVMDETGHIVATEKCEARRPEFPYYNRGAGQEARGAGVSPAIGRSQQKKAQLFEVIGYQTKTNRSKQEFLGEEIYGDVKLEYHLNPAQVRSFATRGEAENFQASLPHGISSNARGLGQYFPQNRGGRSG